MLYLLDADTLITGERDFYPLQRFPVFWRWLVHHAAAGHVKIPLEQFEEITAGQGELPDWLGDEAVRGALLLAEEAAPGAVGLVVAEGYGADLNEDEVEMLGRDPFLIAFALSDPHSRVIVTFEKSAPGQRRGKRKIPDGCAPFGIESCNLRSLLNRLDFTTDWQG